MRLKRIICPVCESEVREISEVDDVHEYSEEIVSRVCEKVECQDNPEQKLIRAIFGER